MPRTAARWGSQAVRSEYLTLAINAGWIGYNLLILLAATAVAVEEVQPEAFPRVPMRVPAVLHYGEKTISVRTTGFSQHEILLSAHDELAAVTPGEQLRITLTADGFSDTFTLLAVSATEFTVLLTTPDDERRFNRVTFARRGHWAEKPDGSTDASFTAGFRILVKSALYGLTSLIEFLPPRWQWIHRFLSTLGHLIPRFKPSNSSSC